MQTNGPTRRPRTPWWRIAIWWVGRALAAYLALMALAAFLIGSDDARLAGAAFVLAALVVFAVTWFVGRINRPTDN